MISLQTDNQIWGVKGKNVKAIGAGRRPSLEGPGECEATGVAHAPEEARVDKPLEVIRSGLA